MRKESTMEPIAPPPRAPGDGDWIGRNRTLVKAAAVVCGVIGVLMNLVHEGGRRSVLSMVVGTGFLLVAVLAWNAPRRVPRPPKYPDRFDKRD
ncbi:MAG: hypothetical protein ACRCYQ_14975 [Nocardioides sp.]